MYRALAWDNQSKLSGFEEPNPFPASQMGTGLRSCESRAALHQDLSIRCKRSLDIVLDFHAWQARACWWRVSAPVQVNGTHLVKVFCNGRCPCYKAWVKQWNKWWNRERERPCVAAKHNAAKCAWFSDLHIFMAEAQKPLAPCGCISRCHLSTGELCFALNLILEEVYEGRPPQTCPGIYIILSIDLTIRLCYVQELVWPHSSQ